MRVQKKISILLIIIGLIFSGGLALIEYFEYRHAELFFENKTNDKVALFEHILSLEGASLEAFAYDYSARQDLLRFVEGKDTGLLRHIADVTLPSFKVDSVWIYSTDFSLLHSVSYMDDISVVEAPLQPAEMEQLFLRGSYFRHFFMRHQTGLLEICTAPVQSHNAQQGSSGLKGFFLAGRFWSDDYVRDLSFLTESTISIAQAHENMSLQPAYNLHAGVIRFSRILQDMNRDPLALMNVTYRAPVITEMFSSSNAKTILLTIFCVSILIFLVVSMMIWVRRPLALLLKAIETGDVSAIRTLQHHQTEFGNLARLLARFFEQKAEITQANERLKAREHELRTVNMQLKAHEQQLWAANQQLDASNKLLMESDRALREGEERYRQLVDTMNDGLAIVDERGIFSYVNIRLGKMLGYAADELVGRAVMDFMDDDSKTVIKNQVLLPDHVDRRMKGYYEAYEIVWIRDDGQHVFTMVSPRAIFDTDGALLGSCAVITDITELKRAEKETKDYKEFLENIIENSRDGILILDHNSTIVLINTALEEMLGCGRLEVIGSPISVLFEPHNVQKFSASMAELFAKGSISLMLQQRRADGRVTEAEMNASVIRDDQGNFAATVAILRDRTEQRKIERQLMQSEKLQALGQLASGVAHDFNNILTAIIGRVQISKKVIKPLPGVGERRRSLDLILQDLDVVEKAALDGAETVRRIQQFARTSEEEQYTVLVEVNSVVKDTLEFTSGRWKAEAEVKGIYIHMRRQLGSVAPVLGSPAELREVITNVINNAIDAMPEGGEIRVKTLMREQQVSIEISDTGLGIPPEVKERIFDPFFTTKGPQSTGLGMSVSYGIISRHGGMISVESTPGRGTTFNIRLPAAQARQEQHVETCEMKHSQKVNILVIEDEDSVRETLCDMLREDGHTVDGARSGDEGIRKFQRGDFDIVFTDLAMPHVTGLQVASRIRSMDPAVPIVLVTGWSINLKTQELTDSGINLVINKPVQMKDVLHTIQQLLEVHGA